MKKRIDEKGSADINDFFTHAAASRITNAVTGVTN